MTDPIIPDKPNLFGSQKWQQTGEKKPQAKKPVEEKPKEEKEEKEEKPVFSIPQTPMQARPLVTSPEIKQEIVRKKSRWKTWIVIIALFIIITGLGFYFILG